MSEANSSRASIAILVGSKGIGGNMRAIIEACATGQVAANVVLVISPKEDVPAVEYARASGVPVAVLPYESTDYPYRLLQLLQQASAQWICLAGYMKLLPLEVVHEYPGHVLNIHPALLPRHGGKGMYGKRVHDAVIASGDPESGCTVHVVTEEYDEGPIILQRSCHVQADDTTETLAARVYALELEAYPQALRELIGS